MVTRWPLDSVAIDGRLEVYDNELDKEKLRETTAVRTVLLPVERIKTATATGL